MKAFFSKVMPSSGNACGKHPGRRNSRSLMVYLQRNYQLYIFLIPAIIYLFIFNYMPMYGVQIAFKDYNIALGINGSRWVGAKHFLRFFNSYQFKNLLSNTLTISFYSLFAGFPIPIIMSLLITHTRSTAFRNTVQTITYAPHFISSVVVVGMLYLFLSPRSGIVNILIQALGGQAQNFMGFPSMYKHLYVWSGIWQNTGWGSIIYVAALSAVNPELYEAARIDGASVAKQILHIDLPSILPTAIILLILNAGSIMSVGAEKAYLMQNAQTAGSQEIISTYVYKIGLIKSQFSYSSAIGLFNSIVNIALLVTVNTISKKLTETSLW